MSQGATGPAEYRLVQLPTAVSARVGSAIHAITGLLPRGRTLSTEAWAQRHRWMLWLLAANAAGLFAFALGQGFGLVHSLIEGGSVALFAVAGAVGRRDRRVGSVAVAIGLLTASAATVHVSHGATEAHFHFFVMIAVLALYEDWLPFLAAVGYVLLHHGLGGVVAPESVFGHADAEAHPWKWAMIHAGFVAGAGAANVLSWRLHEDTRRHMRQLAHIVESSGEAILSVSRDGEVHSWNDGARGIFGWIAEEIVGGPLDVLLPPDRAETERAHLRRVLAGARLEQRDSVWRARDGRLIAVRVSASPMRDVGGAIVGVSAIVQDVTDQRRAALALERERKRLAEAEEIGQMGSWEWICAVDLLEWSDQLYRLFGLRRDEFEATRNGYLQLVHPDDRDRMNEHVERMLSLRRFDAVEHRITRSDGEVRHILLRGDVIVGDDGEVARMLGAAIDITERKLAEDAIRESQDALAHQALHDALTGLPNRTLLGDRLDQALHRGRRDGSRVALLFLDIDRFKVVNDSLGHAAGDALLVAIAGRLDEALRPGDTVARFGGDELAVLCDIEHEHEAMAVAERVVTALSRPFTVAGREVFATASVGVAVSTPASTAETLLRDGDVAMYHAKDLGGARFEMFDAAMSQRLLERLQIEDELRLALSRDELRLHYQPIVALTDQAMVGAEALMRWEHPERGLLAPAAFIPVAEESSLIVQLGEWALRAACRQIAAWHGTVSPDFTLSVNVSARQLAQPGLVDAVRGALEDSGADPGRLTLELTESVLMQHATAQETLLELKRLGVRLALDDFGTGYSSLSYLSRFPLDCLKVDRSFVAKMRPGSPEQAIVAAVATMAEAMGLDLVAEGIETEAQRTGLRNLGYGLGQGYLFAKPMPATALATVLAAPA